MKRFFALAVSFGLIIAAATVVTAASLSTDQVVVNKQSQEMRIQTLRDFMTWHRSNIQPQGSKGLKPASRP